MSDKQFSLDSWMYEVGEPLPEDWQLIVTVAHGEASIDLVDPQGEIIEFVDDDLGVDEMIQQRVDHARVSDGLQPHFKSDL